MLKRAVGGVLMTNYINCLILLWTQPFSENHNSLAVGPGLHPSIHLYSYTSPAGKMSLRPDQESLEGEGEFGFVHRIYVRGRDLCRNSATLPAFL